LADQSKNKWFPWRRLLRSTQTPRPETREVAVSQVTDKYSEYPSDGLTPVRLAEIFKEADAGDVLRQAELFEEMEEKDPHLFSQLQTRKNAVTGLDYEVIPFDSDDPRDKEIAEFVEAQIGGIEGFEDVMLDLLDAIGKGFAVSEIMWSYDEGRVVVGDIRGIKSGSSGTPSTTPSRFGRRTRRRESFFLRTSS
jgi:phage gp29-like protein